MYTGASDHIISRKHLTPEERKTRRKSEFGLSFQTANHEAFSHEIVDFRVDDLGITVTAWVLPDSPPLISLGKLLKIMMQLILGQKRMVILLE